MLSQCTERKRHRGAAPWLEATTGEASVGLEGMKAEGGLVCVCVLLIVKQYTPDTVLCM